MFLAALTLVGAVTAGALAAPGDRAEAERLIAQLEGNPAHKALTVDAVRRSRDSLITAQKLRVQGDDAHAGLAEAVAREWAELGRDLVRTAELEAQSAASRRAADDAGAQVERERALLEEGIAQNGRLRAQLDAVEREKKAEPEKTSRAAARDVGAAPAKSPAKGAVDGGRP